MKLADFDYSGYIYNKFQIVTGNEKLSVTHTIDLVLLANATLRYYATSVELYDMISSTSWNDYCKKNNISQVSAPYSSAAINEFRMNPDSYPIVVDVTGEILEGLVSFVDLGCLLNVQFSYNKQDILKSLDHIKTELWRRAKLQAQIIWLNCT